MNKCLLLLVCSIFLSCNVRYAYRAKVKVESNRSSISSEKDLASIDSVMEGSFLEEDYYGVNNKFNNIGLTGSHLTDTISISKQPILKRRVLKDILRLENNHIRINSSKEKVTLDERLKKANLHAAKVLAIIGLIALLLSICLFYIWLQSVGIQLNGNSNNNILSIMGDVFMFIAAVLFLIALVLFIISSLQ